MEMTNNFLLLFFLWFMFGVQHSFFAQKFFKDKIINFFGIDFVEYFYPILYFLSQLVIYPAFYDLITKIEPCYVFYIIPNNAFINFFLLIKYIGLLLLTISVLSIDVNYFIGTKQLYFFILSRVSKIAKKAVKKQSNSIIFSYVRHPMYLGILLFFLASSTIISDVYFFNLLFLLMYIYIGIFFEEKQLKRDFPEYSNYQNNVAKLNPFITFIKSTNSKHNKNIL